MKRIAFALVVAACGSKPAPVAQPTDPTPVTRPACSATMTTYGVVPFKDKTGKNVDVSGMDELLAVELTKDPCITLVERARLQPIIDEIAHCDADNPDRDQFDCSTFAPSGKILGVQYMVFGDLVMYEPANNAIGVAIRAVSVETGKAVGGETIDSVTPNIDAKLDAHSVEKSAQAGSPTIATLIAKVGARIRAWH